VKQCQDQWEADLEELISKIKVPLIHFWFSTKQLDERIDPSHETVEGIVDIYPQFITGDNLGPITRIGQPLVTCTSNRNQVFTLRSRYTGKPVEIDYASLPGVPSHKETENIYYPSPQMHWDAAITLGAAIREQGLLG